MTAKTYELIALDYAEQCATITLKNEARRNAIGPKMISEILHAHACAIHNDDVRCVILTGAGKAFCAGGDFSQWNKDMRPAPKDPADGDYAELLRTLLRSPKPMIARVNGHAMGGGLGLVAACHFAIGVHDAVVGTPEVKVGLFPMMIMVVLQRVMTRRAVTKMMILGETFTGKEAVGLGLLNETVCAEQLDASIKKITDAINASSGSTVRLGLEAMAAQEDLDLDASLSFLNKRLQACLLTEDAQEGLLAFKEKRKPVWTGR